MITPDEIKQKAERQYIPFLRAWLRGEAFVPMVFSAGKPSSDFVRLKNEVERLQACAKTEGGSGYRIESVTQQKRLLGTQTVPIHVVLDTSKDLLSTIKKDEEFIRFKQDVQLIREQIPQLESWMQTNPKKVVDNHNCWSGLLAVCLYFLDHPRPHLYIRELPINVDTKFIERHTGILKELLEQLLPQEAIMHDTTSFEKRFGLREEEIQVHIRLLDDQLRTHYALLITELTLPHSQCAALPLKGQYCIITENKMTFLTLPPLPNTFAILGGGFKVGSLVSIPWLSECPMIYWGDLDAHGFQILSQLRSIFPHVISLMMEKETLQIFAEYCVRGTPCAVRRLPYLTADEHELFLHLAQNSIRLEQERITHAYALRQIQNTLLQMRNRDRRGSSGGI
ncbi:Wadjet anti-phage system protein JetD domain-containing protein [Ktedonobacter robiniae]|uniref:Wadjet protein JetD C-terminal domain-containing protein n=1 Tax=Ktedonobacter robiniae TaxID=2778365 RepID=A0ABQ3ULZ3_9CHLR|nr:DUF3322 and DUF2220 domain-containing protein [Ktedonobacter robiniae]GHO53744.1 hypothetical protein KSB_22190 [Ktedonobacter robiniae]